MPKFPKAVEPTNKQRALRGKLSLAFYKLRLLEESEVIGESDLVDLLTDLIHFCASKPDYSFTAALAAAQRHYSYETTGKSQKA